MLSVSDPFRELIQFSFPFFPNNIKKSIGSTFWRYYYLKLILSKGRKPETDKLRRLRSLPSECRSISFYSSLWTDFDFFLPFFSTLWYDDRLLSDVVRPNPEGSNGILVVFFLQLVCCFCLSARRISTEEERGEGSLKLRHTRRRIKKQGSVNQGRFWDMNKTNESLVFSPSWCSSFVCFFFVSLDS